MPVLSQDQPTTLTLPLPLAQERCFYNPSQILLPEGT